MPSTIGVATRRREEPQLVTRRGRYAGDVKPPGQAHLLFIRSSEPHATIRAIDTEALA